MSGISYTDLHDRRYEISLGLLSASPRTRKSE